MVFRVCRHIKTNGLQCQSPALRHDKFCYFHARLRRLHQPAVPDVSTVRPTYNARGNFDGMEPEPAAPACLDLGLLEDTASVQVAISTVVNALANNRLELRRATALLYGLQLASSNCRSMPPDRSFVQKEMLRETINGSDGEPIAMPGMNSGNTWHYPDDSPKLYEQEVAELRLDWENSRAKAVEQGGTTLDGGMEQAAEAADANGKNGKRDPAPGTRKLPRAVKCEPVEEDADDDEDEDNEDEDNDDDDDEDEDEEDEEDDDDEDGDDEDDEDDEDEDDDDEDEDDEDEDDSGDLHESHHADLEASSDANSQHNSQDEDDARRDCADEAKIFLTIRVFPVNVRKALRIFSTFNGRIGPVSKKPFRLRNLLLLPPQSGACVAASLRIFHRMRNLPGAGRGRCGRAWLPGKGIAGVA